MRPLFHLWSDERLFRSIELNPSHVLRYLLPPKAKRPYQLRLRAHDYVLPIKNVANFVPRYLYHLSMNLNTLVTAEH